MVIVDRVVTLAALASSVSHYLQGSQGGGVAAEANHLHCITRQDRLTWGSMSVRASLIKSLIESFETVVNGVRLVNESFLSDNRCCRDERDEDDEVGKHVPHPVWTSRRTHNK